MISIRRGSDRGHVDHGWLRTWHTFSFASYRDPEFMGFRTLRVINEDIVAPGTGFGTHAHSDMEIITYVLAGAVEHKDSMGNGSVIRAGEIQRMTAGTGVTHSEFNPSEEDSLHLLQIWILPLANGLRPGYEQKSFAVDERRLSLIASGDGREGSVTVHQDADVWRTILGEGDGVVHGMRPGRGAWVHICRGAAQVNGIGVCETDAAVVEGEVEVRIVAERDAEVLLFDLA